MTVDWAPYLACDTCPAKRSTPCHTLSSGGPQALPPRYADRPHSGRKLAGQPAPAEPEPKPEPKAAPAARSTPTTRRADARTAAVVAAWKAKAAQQKGP